MQAWLDSWNTLLGTGAEPRDLTLLQISLRGIIVFLAALIMVRLGSRRSLAEKTAFDTILLVILASVLSRAINGTGTLVGSIGGGAVLVALHRLLAMAAFRSHRFGQWIKGAEHTLVRDGVLDRHKMARSNVTQHDLEEDLRLSTQTEDLAQIKVARVERSGDISFIKRDR